MSCSTEFFPTLSKYTCPLLAAGCLSVESLVACRRPVVISTPVPCGAVENGSVATPCTAARTTPSAPTVEAVRRAALSSVHDRIRTPATSAAGLGSPRASVNSRSDAHASHHLRPHRRLRDGQLRRANHMAWPGTTQVSRRTSISCSSDISIPSCQACARMHDGGTRCSWTISNEWCAEHT